MNYTKIAGQFVCKMAMPLALMFAACSTEDGNAVSKVDGTPGTEMGGASDEPRIVAYEKISLDSRTRRGSSIRSSPRLGTRSSA